MNEYNLVIVGAGAAGVQAATKATLYGHSVALVDGIEATSGGKTDMAHSIKKLMLRLGMLWESEMFFDPTLEHIYEHARNLYYSLNEDVDNSQDFFENTLKMRTLDFYQGKATLLNMDEIQIEDPNGKKTILEGRNIILATGAKNDSTQIENPEGLPIFHAHNVFTEDIPARIVMQGTCGRICQFATLFSLLGSEVHLVSPDKELFPELDLDLQDAITENLERFNINLHLNNEISAIESSSENPDAIACTLKGNQALEADRVLDILHWSGRAKDIGCAEAGVEVDEQGFVKINEKYRTSVNHIYAIGEATASPMLNNAASNQGRDAIIAMFSLEDGEQLSKSYPLEYYLLPPVSSYGATERHLKQNAIPYVATTASFSQCAKGIAMRNSDGFFKLLVRKDTEAIVGVQIMGRSARELVHFGMMLIEDKTTVTRLIAGILNENTYHKLYRTAALQALYKLRGKGSG